MTDNLARTSESGASESLHVMRRLLAAERQALEALESRLDTSALDAVELLLGCRGKIVVSGMGKCAAVAGKIAGTFSSTGSPAVFMHPAEAVHGDLGMLQPEDAGLLLSNSGETAETVGLANLLRERNTPMIAFTGRPDSTLARRVDIALDTGVNVEGDPNGLAPMASTTAMLALGDALAAAIMHRRAFSRDDYAALHPGGTLGLQLLSRVADLMHSDEAVPVLPQSVSIRQAILEMTEKRLGTVFFTDDENRLSGILTDGDLRRMLQHEPQPLEHPVSDVMTRDPRTTTPDTPAMDALRIMEAGSPVTCLAVIDDDRRIIGALHIHDLIRAGFAAGNRDAGA